MNNNFVYILQKNKRKNNAGQIIETTSLDIRERQIEKPKDNELLIKHDYIGLNFFDMDVSRGIIKKKDGFIPGIEAVGTIERVGSKVKENFSVGDRIAYCTSINGGAYSKYNVIDSDIAILVPDHHQSHEVAGLMMRGIMSHVLLKRVFIVDNKSIILIFNPTGALGHILSQWANYLGVRVIGVITNTGLQASIFNKKKELANTYGCHLVLDYDDVEWAKKVIDFTNGKGVQVVYDTIGGNNLIKSIDVLQYCGLFVSLGQNSSIQLKVSMQKVIEKSIFITRPSIFDYKSDKNELRMTGLEVFNLIESGVIKPRLNKIYKFHEIANAHQDLINRKSNFINIVSVRD